MDEINYINQYYCDKLQTSCNIIRQKYFIIHEANTSIKNDVMHT